MSQVKIFGLRSSLDEHRKALSEAIHKSVVDALGLPVDKKFHRFIALDPEDFLFPADRSEKYTIIEISMFEGRSVEAKKTFIRKLYSEIERLCLIQPQDIEITITETPKANWGIRGVPGDELALNYAINV